MIKTNGKYEDPEKSALLRSVMFILFFIGFLYLCGRIRFMFPPMYSMLIYGTLGSLSGLLVVWLFLKAERKSFVSIGLVWEKKTLLRFTFGLIIGFIIFAVVILALLSFGGLRLRYNPGTISIESLFVYLSIFPLALMEEIGFRSYPQIKLKNAYGIWPSQIIMAIAFGAYHILNGWSVYSSFAGPFVWAFVFGLAALLSRGIAVPTGIHFALNLLQNLTGMKGGKGGIWILDYQEGATRSLMERTNTIGLILQVGVLIAALIGTGVYVRRTNKKRKSVH